MFPRNCIIFFFWLLILTSFGTLTSPVVVGQGVLSCTFENHLQAKCAQMSLLTVLHFWGFLKNLTTLLLHGVIFTRWCPLVCFLPFGVKLDDTCLSIDLAWTSVCQFWHSQLVSDCLKSLIQHSFLLKLQWILVVIFFCDKWIAAHIHYTLSMR